MSAAPVLPRPAFAHASEAELARILDFYQVRWDYEPDIFPIGWSMSGEVVESFAPDFYLPDMELYVELTTLKQKLVRKKNRKLRRLRELYPDIRIKLFYARDFRMLLLKFGRLALHDELSGTIGQATPPRPADRIVTEAGEHAALGIAVVSGPQTQSGPSAQPGLTTQPGLPADELDGGAHVAAADGIDGSANEIDGAAGAPPAHVHAGRGRRRGRRRRREAAAVAFAAADTMPEAGA